ncbi:E3 ubiquitin/ISG15 ligase TRIM25-like [Cebidichthys violaceus]|uniref:E3 ubiquitin/ISG15 ligase TRIM25-like n=1 Tax=Cebidichthys violaceus TaxID=271503 RepID=UPI0035CAEF01
MSSSKPEEQLAPELSCPICLQLFSDPVVLPCGHNYCLACIRMTVKETPLRCPECREEYQGLDSLRKNFKLCSIIEGDQATAPQLDRRPERSVRTAEVLCDYCIDKKTPAVKTCLRCEVSLCSGHLQRHQEKEWHSEHTVVEPLTELGTKSCASHRRPLEYFCSSDMSLMCGTCFLEGLHQNHDVLTFSAAEEEMRRALENRSMAVSCRLQMTESLLKKTEQDQGASETIGDKLVNKALTVMDSMAALVDRYSERLRVLLEEERCMRRKGWQFELGVLEDQQQQFVEAQRSAKEALSETDACIFIHRFMLIEPKLREATTGTIPSVIPSKAPLNTKHLQAGLKTPDFRSEMTGLLDSLHTLLNPLDLTFNFNTAHPCLLVSSDQRTVKYNTAKLPYAEHPERFTSAPQVLCGQGFSSGDHVWVVEVGANTMWSLGVCYKSIPRRGDHSRFGHNSVSWRLQWKNGKLTACQSSCNVALGEMTHHPLRIEIALDYEAGTLMFHNVKGRREHLHTFRVVFKEPVYPAFSIHSNTPQSWITLHNGM